MWFLLRLGLNGVKIFGMSWKLACTLVCQMSIEIYDQILILRNCSKVKICHAFSLGYGLKKVKIAHNVVKVGMHGCISNKNLNLWSNFYSDNLVKSETPSSGFANVWLKGGGNSSKHHKIWHELLSTKWASKSMIKF